MEDPSFFIVIKGVRPRADHEAKGHAFASFQCHSSQAENDRPWLTSTWTSLHGTQKEVNNCESIYSDPWEAHPDFGVRHRTPDRWAVHDTINQKLLFSEGKGRVYELYCSGPKMDSKRLLPTEECIYLRNRFRLYSFMSKICGPKGNSCVMK
jgi:hypothetical protein